MTISGSAPSSYTVLRPGPDVRSELEVKRSRFITVLRRTQSEDGARALVAELRKEFHDARHHCSAFVLGPDRAVQRASDDGEPSGTAGQPMLDALLRRRTPSGNADLSDVTAVVVRYFGGVLLGAGGLVRAYSEAVSSALDAAPLLTRRRLKLARVAVPPAEAGKLDNELRSWGVAVTEADYGPSATTLTVAVADTEAAWREFEERLAALGAGRFSADPAGQDWVDLPG
ncbi:YigZ family protein [Paenarthrobacter sp. DKR-5]|uniref:IMPACT family protein n=1 Tax=Paenarthrobacter sp. DKR-5 TaxID=2835535 RepID=UPI0035B171AC